jgi:hypothetical protein
MDKNLLRNLKQAYRSVINETVEDLDIEETMKEFDTNGFSEKVTVDEMPSGIRGLLKFPYIPNVNVIDSMKYNKEKNQVLLQFKLNFKKLSDIFITKANQEHLIGNTTNKNADRIVSFGLNNLRMIVVFQLTKPLANGQEPKAPEEETSAEPTEKITEGKNFYEKEDDYIPPTADDYIRYYKQVKDKSSLRDKIVGDSIDQQGLSDLYWQLNQTKKSNATVDDVVKSIIGQTSIHESEGSSSVFAFKDNMSSLAAIIQNITTDYSLDADDKKEIKKTWNDTLKVIEKMFRENKLTESEDDDSDWRDYMIRYSNNQLSQKNLRLFYIDQDKNWSKYEIKQIDSGGKPMDFRKYKSLGIVEVLKHKYDDPREIFHDVVETYIRQRLFYDKSNDTWIKS